MVPPMPSSIQFLYSGASSVVVVTAFPSGVSPPCSALAAKVPAQINTRNLRAGFVIGSTSISKQRGHVRAVRFLVAASRPASSLRQEVGVVDISNENVSGLFLFLEMAFQAKRCVAFVQQSLVDGAVGRMADHATLTHCLVLVHPGAPLRRVALEAGLVSAQESKAAAFERLLNIRAAAFNGDSLVWVMTIGATHFPFQHRMMVRQLELCPHFQVTLKTGLRIFPRVDDRVRRATALDVQTARPVAGLAA